MDSDNRGPEIHGPWSHRTWRKCPTAEERMSWFNGSVPEDCRECQTGVEMVIVPRSVDIGGFEVHRALPRIGKTRNSISFRTTQRNLSRCPTCPSRNLCSQAIVLDHQRPDKSSGSGRRSQLRLHGRGRTPSGTSRTPPRNCQPTGLPRIC